MTTQRSDRFADPRISRSLMILTYVFGGVGLAVGIGTVNSDPPSLGWAALVTVGGAGIVSFVRHSIFHRSDAARMGWDYGTTNAFQIEAGMANLSWGLVAVLAVVFDWGLAVEASTFLVFGIYMIGAAVTQVTYKRGAKAVLTSIVFGSLLTYVGLAGLIAG